MEGGESEADAGAEAAAAVVAALSGSEWLEAAKKLLGAAGDELRLVEVKGIGKPMGYVGETMAVRVRTRGATGGEAREAALFLKATSRDCPIRQHLASVARAFPKETGLFNLLARLSPRLRPATTLQPWGARCLLTKNALLLFEDLTAQGYRSLGVRATLDFAHCAAALDALARLHATSLAVEEADRRARRLSPWRLGDRFPDIMQEIMFSEEIPNHMNKYFLCSLNAIKAVVALMPQYKNSSKYQMILEKIDNLPKVAYEMVKISEKHKNVICHGDLWVPNIMFRYSSWGQVEEARLVDMQLTRYAPPALDVAALLHACARRELREERGGELRDLYHAALTRSLEGAGFPAKDALLPRKDFEESWNECRRFGPVVAACLPGDLLRPLSLPKAPEDLERFLTEDRAELVAQTFQKDEEYRDRVSEIVEDLVDTVILGK